MSQDVEIAIFLDTNFLFSMIGLDDEASSELAEVLRDLIQQLTDRLRIQLYISPSTLREASKTLSSYQDRLSNIFLPHSVTALLDGPLSEASGITRQFLEKMRSSAYKLTAAEYFRPYIANLVSVCQQYGIHVHTDDPDELIDDNDLREDIDALLQSQRRSPGIRTKTYEAAKHDVVLWNFVHQMRPETLSTPLDAKYWILTMDFGLIRFDASRNSSVDTQVPVCVHPATFAQMLQFWIPRTPQSEKALIAGLKALLPREFDPEAEQITIKILQVLSLYENVHDLTEQTVSSIFMNDALRHKLRSTTSIEEDIELIHEALLTESVELREQLAEQEKGSKLQQEEILRERALRRTLEQENQELRAQQRSARSDQHRVQSQLEQAKRNLSEKDRTIQRLEERLLKLEKAEETSRRAAQVKQAKFRLTLGWILSLLLAWALASVGVPKLLAHIDANTRTLRVLLGTIVLIAWAIGVDIWSGSNDMPELSRWKPLKFFRRVGRWIVPVANGVSKELIVNFLLEP